MKVSWWTRLKIRLKHARVGQAHMRKLRIDFDEIMTAGWTDPPLSEPTVKRSTRLTSADPINLTSDPVD